MITLIYTRSDKWLITKEIPENPSFWQNKFYWHETDLSFENSSQCADFLKDEFKLSVENEKHLIETVENSRESFFEISLNTDNSLSIKPIQLRIMQQEGELIDWEDWEYVFEKRGNDFFLWVYIAGKFSFFDASKEIKLTSSQIERWQKNGKTYIRQLVTEIQQER